MTDVSVLYIVNIEDKTENKQIEFFDFDFMIKYQDVYNIRYIYSKYTEK